MELFRAIKESDLASANTPQSRLDSVRLPSNIPYIVDNLWELLRPEQMPSRRHAVYASPSEALALANASSGAEGERYIAMRLLLSGPVKVAQLPVTDARYHPDLRRVARVIQQHSTYLTTMAGTTRAAALGSLFFPGASKSEMTSWVQGAKANGDTQLVSLVDDLLAACQLWDEAVIEPVDAEGELFFELMPGSTYTLSAPAEA